MSFKCLIIDDEPLAINVIKNYLEEFSSIEITTTFSNAIEGLEFLKSNDIDLIFLDINMPLLDGLNFIKSLATKPAIIITTAYKEYALETYELSVLDYLLKPISFPRFTIAINRFLEKHTNNTRTQKKLNDRAHIFVKIDKKKMKKIYLDEILVIESLRDYLKISTSTDRYIIHQTLSSFTEQLPSDNFIRIHRSYTVAINKIDVIEGNSIKIEDIMYVIGRTYIDDVKKKILG
jgi:DNA-binding LytR/AlgR family response regulator|tara:strand:- start:161 stop:862 length:702 start_codon:yes stop_codon:yes gene_type:complete